VSEPNHPDEEDEEAFAALYPGSMALCVARREPAPPAGPAEVCISGGDSGGAVCSCCERPGQELGPCCERHHDQLVCTDVAGCRDFLHAQLRAARQPRVCDGW
jgi:hypothetical protein